MDTHAIVNQISQQLAGARCQQDLDHQLATIPNQHWPLFVAALRHRIADCQPTQPRQARLLEELLQSYLRRWSVVRATG